MDVKSVYTIPYGMVLCFDQDGEQIQNLQTSLLELFFMNLESRGVDPTKIPTIIIIGHENEVVKPFKTETGAWNYSIEKMEPLIERIARFQDEIQRSLVKINTHIHIARLDPFDPNP